MINILVTGATGFVGQNFLEYIKTSTNDINIISCDLRKENWENHFYNSDVVIHLAGKAHDLKNTSQPELYYKINTDLTKKVYDNFLSSKVRVFIYVSSVKAVVDSIAHVLSESQFPKPTTIYGKSKLLAENYIINNFPNKISEKKVYILRPCLIHGPKNKGNLTVLYNYINSGFPWPFGRFDNLRSYCSIKNLCFILKELSERDDIESGIYNVADSKSISTNNLIKFISYINKKKARIFYIPKSIVIFIFKIGDFFKLPINSEKLSKLTENFIVSNNKIISALKKDLPYTLEEGLSQTFTYFNENKFK